MDRRAVRDRDACLRHELAQLRLAVLDRLDFVIQVVDLAAALELAQHRLAHDAAYARCTNVLIASRRCGAVAITEKSRSPSSDIAERARDRCRGERQHVDLGAQCA